MRLLFHAYGFFSRSVCSLLESCTSIFVVIENVSFENASLIVWACLCTDTAIEFGFHTNTHAHITCIWCTVYVKGILKFISCIAVGRMNDVKKGLLNITRILFIRLRVVRVVDIACGVVHKRRVRIYLCIHIHGIRIRGDSCVSVCIHIYGINLCVSVFVLV